MPNDKKKLATKFKPFMVFGLVAFANLKYVLLMLPKWLSFAKLGWLATKFWSLWLSLGLYAVAFGWSFAWMIIIVLLLHEGGHWIWMRAYGLNPGLPGFVPFLGAFVAMKKLPKDEASHAWVALAGPLVGGVTSAALYFAGAKLNNDWLLGLGHLGFLLNLIQLVPTKPLDGGFIIAAISRKLLIPGMLILFGVAYFMQSPLLFVIALLAGLDIIENSGNKELLQRRVQTSDAKTVGELIAEIEKVPTADLLKPPSTSQRWLIGLSYLILALALGQFFAVSSDNLPTILKH